MEIMFQKVLITLVNVQFSQKSLHFWDMEFMFVVWKCTDIYSGKSENHFCHNNPVTVHFHHIKSDTCLTEVADGSNESSYYPDEELGPNLQMGSLLK